MAKQLNVDMRFTADTSKAKQSITELQSAIQKLGYGTTPRSGLINVAEFEKASTAARELAYHLNNAYNAKTGNLDLSKLNASLKSSGTNLRDLTSGFKNAGEVGQQAFVSLAKAIANADQPSISINTHLSTMFTTLKNVARFQLSSSIMHGLIGGVQTAFNYARDLNQSLNNIRIVTGQSTEQMARFAEQANKTARSLSATTLDYTNASLIYYQQGLNDAEVKARTDVTVKLANISRQSAEEVSNQMTAIWNNFDQGSHSMEYFADVITALGATTASSSEEIATGLEKFAPIAGTIGLSYEKATSVLAAIVANTRQSADTVGTGLRTIFSRFESLKLGETLEDGVDLNKYTKAMQTIGVNVLDANGKLRDMDSILDDVAANWKKLDDTQKTAFATTVGGVRQYTNLMALFENWDDVQTNMLTASGAEGTLQKQADIYAESWEAARKRVKTATQGLYDTLIDEDFFIGIDKALEHILVGINKFLEGFGGIRSVVGGVLSFILAAVSNKIGPAIKKVVQDIQILSGGSQKVYGQMQRNASAMIREEIASKNPDGTDKYNTVQKAELEGANSLLLAKTKLGMVEDKLSASEKMRAQLAIEGLQKQQEEVKRLAEEQVAAEKAVEKAAKEADQVRENELKRLRAKTEQANKKVSTAEENKQKAANNLNVTDVNRQGSSIFRTSDQLANKTYNFAGDKEAIQAWLLELKTLEDQAYNQGLQIQEALVKGIISGEGESSVDISSELQNLFNFDELKIDTNLLEGLSDEAATQALEQQKDKVELLANSLGKVGEYAPEVERALRDVAQAPTPKDYNEALERLQKACEDANIPAEKLRDALKNTGGDPKAFDQYINACQRLKAAQEAAAEAKKELEEIEKNGGSTDAMAAAQEKLAAATREAGDAANAASAALSNLKKNANGLNFQHTLTGVEGFTKVASSLGQINMAINAVKGMINSLGDESATAGEKISAVFMGISMGIPAIIGAYSSLSTVINGVATALATQGALSEATTAKLMANGVAAQFAGAGYDTQTIAIVKKVAIAQADLFTNEALSTSEGKTAAARAIATAMAEAGIIANTEDAITKTADAMATDVLTASNVALKLSMIEIVAIIAAVAAIIAIAVKAIDLMRDSYNKDAIAAANAAAAAEELGKKSEEAAQKAQQIVDVFSKYDEAVEMLSKCEKGTQAWKDALQDVNNIVLDILATMPELISDMQISRDENGMFVIENTDDIIAQYQAKATNAKAAAVMANISANEASLQSIRTDRQRELLSLKGHTFEEQETYWEPGAIAESTRWVTKSSVNEILNNAQNYLGLSMEEFAQVLLNTGDFVKSDLFDSAGNATEALQTFYESTMELGVGMEDLQKQMDVSAQILAESYLGDRYSTEAKRVAATGYQDKYDEIYAQVMEQSNNYSASDKQSDLLSNRDSIWQRYLRAIGESTLNYKLVSNAIQGEDNEREYVFKVGTSSEEQRVSAEQIAATIAAAEALSALEVSARDAQESLGGMQENIDTLPPVTGGEEDEGGTPEERHYDAGDITDYLATGNFEGSNQAAVEDILADIGSFGGEDVYAQTQAYLQSILGDEVGSQIDAQDFYDKLAGLDFSSVGSDLSATARASFESAIADSDAFKALGIGDQAEAAALFQEMFNGLGAEAVDAFGEQFSELSTEQMSGLTDVLNNFDWSTGDIDALWQSLEQVGITAEDVNLQPFIDYMVEAAAIAGTFSGATALFKGIQDIVKSLSTGDTITDDNFKKLTSELGVSQSLLDQYFITMADGTHKLVGSAEAFQAAIKPSMVKQFATNIETAQSSNKQIEAIQSSGYELTDLKQVAGQRGIYGSTHRQNANGEWADTTDRDLVAAQLNLLQNAGYASNTEGLGASQLAEWQNTLASGGNFNYEDLQHIAEGVDLVSASCENLDEIMQQNNDTIAYNQMAMATSATTLQELQLLGEQYNLGNEALSTGLMNLGTMHANASQELDAYRRALGSGNEELIHNAEVNLEAAIKAGEAAEAYGLDATALEDLTDSFREYNEELSTGDGMLTSNAEAAKDAAVRYMRLNRAVEDLSDNYSDYNKALKEFKKAGTDADKYYQMSTSSMQKFRKTMADLLDTSEDFIGIDFFESLDPKDVEAAAQGDEEAIKRIRDAFIDAQGAAAGLDPGDIEAFKSALDGLEEGAVIDINNSPFLMKLIESQLAAGATAADIQSLLSGFGIDCDVSDFNSSMAEAADTAAAAGDAIVESLGMDAETTSATASSSDTSQDVGFTETITTQEVTANDEVLETQNGSTPTTVPVTQHLTGFTKTVTPDVESETTTKEQSVNAVKISNAHKSAGGGVSNKNKGKSGGGGGGGGGGKQKKKDAAKADKSTRYHTVKARQSNNSNRQAEINRQKERAFGAAKIKQAQKEIDLQKEQIILQREYLSEIKDYLGKDKADMEKAWSNLKLGFKINIDKDGVITNYQEIEDALLKKENELIEKYNASTAEDKDEWFEKEKKKLDEFKELMATYEETQDLYEGELTKLQEYLDAISDAALELLQTKIQLNIDVKQDELGLLEFMLEKIDDNAYKAAEAISLFGKETTNFLDQIGIYQTGLSELLANKGLDATKLDSYSIADLLNAGFTQNDVDQIREWRDAILDANKSLLEMRSNIVDRVINTFDDLNDRVNNSYDLFDHYNDMLENYRDITDTLGRHINKEQKKLINDLNKAMLENSKTQLATSKELYDNMLKEQEEAKKAYDEAVAAGDEETARQWQEILDTINEATNEAQETWMTQWQETTDMIQEIFETMLDQIVEDFNAAMGGAFGSLDYLSEAFKRNAETDELYLQDFDKLYELNKLQRDLNKVLSDTRGVTNRKEMLELQKEITEAQQAGVRLSQYDVEVLRKKFELQQAYNDLQLAKDAKSTVRLQRDREGNWGYVYTADEDAVAEAEQEYEDKLHEYQELNNNYIKQLQEQALEAQQTYRDTLREIMEDVTLTDEERQARIDELNEWYLAQQQFFEEQSNHVFENQSGTLERYLNTYATAIDDLIDTWEETSLADLTGLSTLDEYMNNWMISSEAFLTGLKGALDDRKQQVEDILALTGTSIEDFGTQTEKAINDIGKASQDTQKDVLDLASILNDNFNEALKEAVNWEKEYATQIDAATEANLAFAASLNAVIEKLSDVNNIKEDQYDREQRLYESKRILHDAGKVSDAEYQKAEDRWFEFLHKYYRDNAEEAQTASFDTGGYTGIWGNEGRLAFLHEKEQIFNSTDTTNLLAAAKILRTIDLQISRFSNGFGEQSIPTIDSSGTILEQSVHITAEFPNAVNHAEIEEAFTNLANKATQYANRKNG